MLMDIQLVCSYDSLQRWAGCGISSWGAPRSNFYMHWWMDKAF